MLEIRDKGFGVKASGGKLRFKSASNSDKTKTSKTEKGVVSPFKKYMTGDRKTVKGGQRGRNNNESYPSKKRNEIGEREKSQRKLTFKPSAMLSPVPAVLVTCRDLKGNENVITIAWAGTVCSNPPMLSISVKPERYSHHMIEETGEFVVNVPSSDQVRWVDYCGVTSGKNVDKFQKAGFTKQSATTVNVPIIKECPLNIECRVREKLELGSHTMFIAEIVAIQASQGLMQESGRLAVEKGKLFAYVHGHYYSIGKRLGKFGFSIQKKRTRSTNFSNPKK